MVSEQEAYRSAYELFRFAELDHLLRGPLRTRHIVRMRGRTREYVLSREGLESAIKRLGIQTGMAEEVFCDYEAFKSEVKNRMMSNRRQSTYNLFNELKGDLFKGFLRRIKAFPLSRLALDAVIGDGLQVRVASLIDFGYCSFEPPRITINRGKSKEEREITLLHESGHAYYFGPEPLQEMPNHAAIEKALDEEAKRVLKSNPELPNYLVRNLQLMFGVSPLPAVVEAFDV